MYNMKSSSYKCAIVFGILLNKLDNAEDTEES